MEISVDQNKKKALLKQLVIWLLSDWSNIWFTAGKSAAQKLRLSQC